MSITFTVCKLNVEDNIYRQIEGTPEINLSNHNAYEFMRMLGTQPEPVDYWSNDQLNELEQRICVRLLDEGDRQGYIRPTVESKGKGGCTIIQCGVSDDYWVLNLKRLREMVIHAREHEAVIFWD